MPNYQFSGVARDSSIRAIGSLFRHQQGSRWYVDVRFWPQQSKNSLSLANAPILSRNAALISGETAPRRGWRQDISIKNTTNWAVQKIKDCPINGSRARYDNDQFCFVFQNDGGLTVYLPQFELARALFFHDSYLACTSLTPAALALEFDTHIDKSGRSARITVMPSSGYPLKHFNDVHCREVLSWILLDDEARRSYESIGTNQLQHGFNDENYRRWNFRFTPPQIANGTFHVRGRFDPETQCLFVYEIDKIRGLKANVPEEVIFEHPDFKHPERVKGSGDAYPVEPFKDIEVEDDGSANADTSTIIIHSAGISIGFDNQFKTITLGVKTTASPHGEWDAEKSVDGKLVVSTEDPVQGGAFTSADWDNLNGPSDSSLFFENKFKCFMKMINELTWQHGCSIIDKNISKLPPFVRCKRYLLSSGGPRSIAAIILRSGDKEFHILEVDTSDGEKSLSTQLLRLKNPTTWLRDLENIKRRLVKGSLTWPTRTLGDLCGRDGYQGISHPQTSLANKGVLPPDSIARWAERFFEWMGRI
ncbi:MAG TPA: Tn7-like element transposition protein TnsE [Desulfovibrio sp.]|uniref:Tn7-like element transposition protein TnsE n=1 Tax=Desulfovibrio sp. TaxID=885 RepID=UPI002C43ED9F|nr:Tn7-like element transposition protein TnsE [Desulfovibrio sp.]HMM39618.1 Tn7-like element transposition protein TnsE [Desulfovibrio sp.]